MAKKLNAAMTEEVNEPEVEDQLSKETEKAEGEANVAKEIDPSMAEEVIATEIENQFSTETEEAEKEATMAEENNPSETESQLPKETEKARKRFFMGEVINAPMTKEFNAVEMEKEFRPIGTDAASRYPEVARTIPHVGDLSTHKDKYKGFFPYLSTQGLGLEKEILEEEEKARQERFNIKNYKWSICLVALLGLVVNLYFVFLHASSSGGKIDSQKVFPRTSRK